MTRDSHAARSSDEVHCSRLFRAGPQAFRIEADDPLVLEAIESDLRDLALLLVEPGVGGATALQVARRDPPSGTHPWRVSRDGEICEEVTEAYLRPYVLWEVTRLLLESGEAATPIHAAAVALDGRAVILAGQSYAGKSTLAGWLTAHGWGFLTDEVSRVSRSGDAWEVQAFPRPIGVRRPTPLEPFLDSSVGSEIETLVPASSLGELSGPAHVAAIVLPDRSPGVPARLEDVHPATAVRLLADHLPLRVGRGREGFREVVALCASVPVYSLGTADLSLAERVLRTVVSS